MSFPPEIWLQIIWHLATTSHRASLHPLLLVSRAMYDLAVPLMYEIISKPPRTYPFEASSAWIESLAAQVTNRLDYTEELTLNFGSNPSNHGVCDRAASKIVAAMPNLKKLRIHVWFPVAALLKAIHPAAQLTHLSCSVSIKPQVLRDLVVSQPTLEALAIVSGTVTRVDLPPDALPRLCTFIGDSDLWEIFLKGRAVEHLSGHLTHSPTFQDPQEILQNIRTLSVECSDRTGIQTIAPFLKSIECLSIKGTAGLTYGNIRPRDMFLIPSNNFYYFSFGGKHVPEVSVTTDATAMFGKFPSLKIVDQTKDTRMALPSQATRFMRNHPSPTTIWFPQLQPWEPWWAVYPKS